MKNQDLIHIGLYLTLFIILLITLISSVMLVRIMKYHTLMRAEMRNRLLLKRMEPHFIGNLLQSLTGLFYSGKKKEVLELIEESSALFRSNFEFSDADFIPLEQELKLLMQFLHTRNNMSEGRIYYELRLNFQSTASRLLVPAMILQPILENALNHGVRNQKNPRIILEVTVSDTLRFRIIDNGPGLPDQKEKKRTGSLDVISERLYLLHYFHKWNLSLNYMNDLSEYNLEQGCGIEITMPIITTS